jgi:hypothetical protein
VRRYDAAGRRTKRTLPDNRQQLTGYDTLGRVATTQFVKPGASCTTNGGDCVTLTSTYGDGGRRTSLAPCNTFDATERLYYCERTRESSPL